MTYSTRWSVIHGAARGVQSDREEFARRYEEVIRAYLAARWRDTPLRQEIDDAVQEVFVGCFREDGVLARVEQGHPGGFRPYFFASIRNVARGFERRRQRQRVNPAGDPGVLDTLEADEEGLSTILDRAWAMAIVKEAREYQAERAQGAGQDARRRVELLRLRFNEGLPIREIARLWEEDPSRLHHEYAKARAEFQESLLEVVSFHHPGTPEEVERECARLVDLLE